MYLHGNWATVGPLGLSFKCGTIQKRVSLDVVVKIVSLMIISTYNHWGMWLTCGKRPGKNSPNKVT